MLPNYTTPRATAAIHSKVRSGGSSVVMEFSRSGRNGRGGGGSSNENTKKITKNRFTKRRRGKELSTIGGVGERKAWQGESQKETGGGAGRFRKIAKYGKFVLVIKPGGGGGGNWNIV